MKTLTKIVYGVLIYWIAFVAVSWIAYFKTGAVPDSLVTAGLGGSCAELVCTAFIEWAKRKYEPKGPEEHPEEKDDGVDFMDIDGEDPGNEEDQENE